MRRGNCAGAMQYVPELTWILFLRILDEREQREEQESEAVGGTFRPSLASPFRWRDWGAPPAEDAAEPAPGWKRLALKKSAAGSFFNFVNAELLPHLKRLKNVPDATPRQKVISEIMTGVDRVRIDTERGSHLPGDACWPVQPCIALDACKLEHMRHGLRPINQLLLAMCQL